MKESIYSGYYGACSEPTNPRDPFKYVINSKSLIGSSTDELVKEYKAKAKEVYPDLTNQFADFIAFDNSFIEETLKQGLLLFGGYHGALRFSNKGVQMAFTALSINALSQEAAQELLMKKNLSDYWEADGFTNRVAKATLIEQGLIDQWKGLIKS